MITKFFKVLQVTVQKLDISVISVERKQILQPLIDYIQSKKDADEFIRLNFICTHNSRRSHLSQVWAQTMAFYFQVKNVYCYSGGTEATALFPVVAKTLKNNGFEVKLLSRGENPIYAIKHSNNEHPVIAFSKTFDDAFNPKAEFAAIMTCSSAEKGCPFISGAEKRVPITYQDPKISDNTQHQARTYNERSLQIATELYYVFSKIN